MVQLVIRINDMVKTYDIPIQAIQLPQCTYPQVYNPATGRCENPPAIGQCPSGTEYDPITNTCKPSISCPSGTLYDSATNTCKSTLPPTITAKTIQISTLRSAFRTQEIPILVTATCTNPPSVINGEDASLLIDGKIVSTKTVVGGSVSFSYTFKEAGVHTIRVVIPRSASCDTDGSSSVQIDISAEIPSTLDRLKIEREAQAKISAEIERVREEIRKYAGGVI